MAGIELTDDEIALLTAQQRRDLIRRLGRMDVTGMPTWRQVRAIRRRRMIAMAAALVVLVPWTAYLAATLPARHVVRHWTLTWVGFDVLLLIAFLLTAVFGLLRRQLVVFAALTTATMLVCDAWFDVSTAGPHDLRASLASALLAELPLAILLFGGALRLLRLTALRLGVVEPGARLWHVPIPIADLFDRPDDDRKL